MCVCMQSMPTYYKPHVCMFLVYTCRHAQPHTGPPAYAYACMYACIHVHTGSPACAYIRMRAYMHAAMRTYTGPPAYAYVQSCTHMYAYMRKHMNVYIHRHTCSHSRVYMTDFVCIRCMYVNMQLCAHIQDRRRMRTSVYMQSYTHNKRVRTYAYMPVVRMQLCAHIQDRMRMHACVYMHSP